MENLPEKSEETEDHEDTLQDFYKRRPSLYSSEYTISEFVNRKAIEFEKENGIEDLRGENLEGWGIVPDIILEKIFTYLDIPDKYSASIVCRQWQRAFYMQASWNTFLLADHTLTRHKFNYYMGWQQILDHLRAQVCIFRIGKFIRNIILSKMSNLFNLYEFMNLLSYYIERYNDDKARPPLHIRSLKFIFGCDTQTQEQAVYGTGGKILEALQRLMINLDEMQRLELIDLLLDSPSEAIHLLDDACAYLCERLEQLVLINTTRGQFDLLHPACFINLRVLVISPQNLGSETVELLCTNLKLEEVHIIQNKYCEAAIAVDRRSWAKATFKVFLRTVGEKDKEIIWQEKAPVHSIIYDCPKTKLQWESILTTIDFYSAKLEEYGHLSLPRFGRSRKFDDRPDLMLLTLCRKCPYLTTLYVRERISTSTCLLLVALSPNLRYLFIRQNGLILKCDYKRHNLELDTNFCQWIEMNSRSYAKTKNEISRLLCKEWFSLTDVQFKEICRSKAAY